jgi:serine/threonine protein phosphatase PrpC
MDVTGAMGCRCDACGAPLAEGDRFCERCGTRLAGEEAEDRGAAPDRIEFDRASAGAITDRGRVHRRNEDAFHLEILGQHRVAAVVCDGISSASSGDVAAQRAAAAAAGTLALALTDSARDGTAVTLDAINAAYSAVGQVPWTRRGDRATPSCTLVSGLWRDGEVVVSSVGDSRAYWIDSEGARQLTVDDSWAEEQVAGGLLTASQAAQDPRSHSITHWIGVDAPERPPRLATVIPDGPARLLLCTDGLWNYLAGAAELGELVDALPSGASPAAVARALTDTAIARGGRDNVTVAVVGITSS